MIQRMLSSEKRLAFKLIKTVKKNRLNRKII